MGLHGNIFFGAGVATTAWALYSWVADTHYDAGYQRGRLDEKAASLLAKSQMQPANYCLTIDGQYTYAMQTAVDEFSNVAGTEVTYLNVQPSPVSPTIVVSGMERPIGFQRTDDQYIESLFQASADMDGIKNAASLMFENEGCAMHNTFTLYASAKEYIWSDIGVAVAGMADTYRDFSGTDEKVESYRTQLEENRADAMASLPAYLPQ